MHASCPMELTEEPFVRLPHHPQHLLMRILDPDPLKRITAAEIVQCEWFKEIRLCVKYNNENAAAEEHKSGDCVAVEHAHYTDLRCSSALKLDSAVSINIRESLKR